MRACPSLAAAAAAFCFGATPALAEEAAVQAHYAGYVRGLNVFDLDITVSLQESAYRLQAAFKLTGVLGALFHADGQTVVDGRFDGARAVPRELFSAARFDGTAHVIQLDWQNGAPKVTQMVPPPEAEREAVPPSEQAQTIDTLSAIAILLHQATKTGTCEASTRTFDGVRLSEFAARTVGAEALEATDRSSFQGQALRCDVSGRMIGGFMRDADNAALRRPKQGTAWLARLAPGQPFVPVRIVFYDEGSVSATLYLAPPPPSP